MQRFWKNYSVDFADTHGVCVDGSGISNSQTSSILIRLKKTIPKYVAANTWNGVGNMSIEDRDWFREDYRERERKYGGDFSLHSTPKKTDRENPKSGMGTLCRLRC